MKNTNTRVDLVALAGDVGGTVVTAAKSKATFTLVSEGGGTGPLLVAHVPNLFASNFPYHVVNHSKKKIYMFWQKGEVSEYDIKTIEKQLGTLRKIASTKLTADAKNDFLAFIGDNESKKICGLSVPAILCIGTEVSDVPSYNELGKVFRALWHKAFLGNAASKVYKYTDPLSMLPIIFGTY